MSNTDPKVLYQTAFDVLALLKAGADTVDWEPDTVGISSGEPAIDCDAIVAWVSSLTADGNKCTVSTRVELTYQLHVCVGADIEETEIFDTAELSHEIAWAVWVELLQACCEPNIAFDNPELVDRFTLGPLRIVTNIGGLGVWRGTVTWYQSPLEIVGS
ncbi:MAG: hypothetical protein GY906_10425 [bacterium]|nr:hypothetical protein [bacterium]